MEVYNSEEEQVQAIKQWWKDNAVSLIAGIVIGFIALGGYRYWIETQSVKAQHASILYSTVQSGAKDKEQVTERLKTEFSSTPYAALAALVMAKDYVDNNQAEKAISQLKWVVDNSHDEGIQHIAKQRLARLYLSVNNIDAAESVVKDIKVRAFSATYNEIRGDINLAKKLPAQARASYRLALAAMTPGDRRYATVKMKLDDLAEPKQTAADSKTKTTGAK